MQELNDLNGLTKDQMGLMLQIGLKVVQNTLSSGKCHVSRLPNGDFHFHHPDEFEFKGPVVQDDMGDKQVARALLDRGFDREYIKKFIIERRRKLNAVDSS
jgi:hypothetical protein